jgi:hypothetical protein
MQKIQPEKAIEILREHGMDVTVEQAKLILDFFCKLANIALTQSLENEDSRFIHPRKHGRTG